ncbi:MAG: type II secretion system protein GspJ [Spirochaetes bacterium]|nr:type II secretion system protein GspJ [Spirochaetota bacterium]
MVVGVAVSSIMLLMLYTSYRTTLSIVKRVSGYAEFYENINLAIKKIDSDISNCYFKKEGTAHFISTTGDGNSKLNFVTINHKDISMKGDLKRPNPDCDIKEVGYYLIKDKDYQDINLLIKREQSNYDKDPEGGGEQNIILENVVSLKFNFKQNNDWVDKWDSRQNNLYPEAVKTTLIVKNYEGIVDKYIFISNVNLSINTQGQK